MASVYKRFGIRASVLLVWSVAYGYLFALTALAEPAPRPELAVDVTDPVALIATHTADAAEASRLLVLQRDGVLVVVDRLLGEPLVTRFRLQAGDQAAPLKYEAAALLSEQTLVCVARTGDGEADQGQASAGWRLERYDLSAGTLKVATENNLRLTAEQSITPATDTASLEAFTCGGVVKAAKQLFLAMGDGIWQARHLSDQLGTIRPQVGTPVLASALTLTPEGYLLLAQLDSNEALQLQYRAPDRLDEPPVMAVTTDLSGVRSFVFSPQPAPYDSVLYALGSRDSVRGFYRIDSRTDENGQPACQAVLIQPVPNAVAMAMSEEGVCYVVTLDPQTNLGKLQRVPLSGSRE